nr:unnamed protein product [Callosobruchus analis]
MEKRKQKLGLQLDAIEDERNLVNENIQSIVNQISSYKENPELLQPKDYPVLFSYELDVLKKLSEINFELESLIEAYPLKGKCVVQKTELKMETSNEQTETGPNLCNISVGNNITVSNCTNLSGRLVENVGNVQVSECDECIDVVDLQVVRESVKEISTKLGISQENMSAIKNYYEKPSSSHPSIPHCSTSRIEPEHSNHFEVPEKDTGPCNNLRTAFGTSNIQPVICSEESSDSTETEMLVSLQKNMHHENLVSHLTYNDVENNDESTTEYSICSSSTEQYSDYIDCLSNECNFGSSGKTMQNIQNSAIEKLNNYISVGASDVSASNEVDNVRMKDDFQNQQPVQFSALEKLPLRQACFSPDLVVSPNIVLQPTKEENCVVVKNFEPEFSKKKKKHRHKKTTNCETLLDIPSKELPKDDSLCAFSHIENPSEFYLHVFDTETQMIDLMTDKLNEFYKNMKSSYNDKESAFKSIGRYCAVYVGEYDRWYRAEVLDWHLESKTENVEVQLVDFGKRCVLTYKNLKKLTEEFVQVPKLAIKCHFPLMYPPGSTELEKLSQWPAFSVDALLGLSGLEGTNEEEKKIFQIVYASYVEDLKSVAVDLIDTNESDEEKTVGQILIDLHMVVQIIPSIYHDSEDDFETMLYDDINILETAENINEAVAGYDARDEARICRFTKPDGTCFKGKNCKLEHVLLPKDGFTTDKEPVYKAAMYSLILPKVGEIVTILITAYIDSCNFFANIIRTPFCSDTGYVIDSELEELMKSINTPAVVRTFRTMKILPGIGEIVLVRPPTLKKWLRAIVRSSNVTNPHNGESKIEVYSVDFGNIFVVHLSDIRKIEPHLLRLPFQAVHCYLDKYKFKKNCDKQQCKDFFAKNFYFHNFAALILSSSLPLKMQLTRFNGINVGEALVRFGFAERTKYDLNPLDDCPIAVL